MNRDEMLFWRMVDTYIHDESENKKEEIGT